MKMKRTTKKIYEGEGNTPTQWIKKSWAYGLGLLYYYYYYNNSEFIIPCKFFIIKQLQGIINSELL